MLYAKVVQDPIDALDLFEVAVASGVDSALDTEDAIL